jgi:hypothetical protein
LKDLEARGIDIFSARQIWDHGWDCENRKCVMINQINFH